MTTHPDNSGVALAEWAVKHAGQFTPISISNSTQRGLPSSVPAIILPDGAGGLKIMSVKPILEEHRVHPEFRKGTAIVGDLASFIAHVNRFSNTDSVLFAEPSREKPLLLAVLDYHQAVNVKLPAELGDNEPAPISAGRDALPQFGQHRTSYAFPLSDEWLAWTAVAGKPAAGKNAPNAMSEIEFAEFLEDRINDVAAGPFSATSNAMKMAAKLGSKFAEPSRLMELSRGLKVHVDHKYKGANNLSSGEVAFTWSEEHKDEAGAALVVPNLFVIAIPVFRGGDLFAIPVRLRYRISSGRVFWTLKLYQEEVMFDIAFQEACATAAKETKLPLIVGKPEA